MAAPDLSTLGKRLAYARQLRGFPRQQDLAKRAGVSQSTIGNLEAETRQRPRNLLQIASALGVSAVWLEFGTGPMEAENPRLRPEVSDLALLIDSSLSTEQVPRLREMVLAFGKGSS